MVLLATMITCAGVVGDEHGNDDGSGTGLIVVTKMLIVIRW